MHLKTMTLRGLPMRMLLGSRFVVETGEVVIVGIVVVIAATEAVGIVGTVVAGVGSGEGVVGEGGFGGGSVGECLWRQTLPCPFSVKEMGRSQSGSRLDVALLQTSSAVR
jgi:hypothetical protein